MHYTDIVSQKKKYITVNIFLFKVAIETLENGVNSVQSYQ